MEADTSSILDEKIASILKTGATEVNDKLLLFNAVEQCISQITKCPVEFVEECIFLYLMPSIENLFVEIYDENGNIHTKEQIQDISRNLVMAISLTDFIGSILEYVSVKLETVNIVAFKSIFSELPNCFHFTYKHCRESQKKYQTLLEDCKEILELYKKNQDYYVKFLNILNTITVSADDRESSEVLIQVIQSLSQINETLSGLNVKALTDSWKGYSSLVDKHYEVLSKNNIFCTKEIEVIKQQIQSFMNTVLNSDDGKQGLMYVKLSGFLLKLALKIVTKFWEYIKVNHLRVIHDFITTVFCYSIDFLVKWNLNVEVKICIQSCLHDVLILYVQENNILDGNVINELLSDSNTVENKNIGCMMLDLKILRYISNQPNNTIDCVLFNNVLNHIFSDISLYFPDLSYGMAKNENNFFNNLCMGITQCIIDHDGFYNPDFERTLIENILGNEICCHVFASEIWINILSFVERDTRKCIVLDLAATIKGLKTDISFNTIKLSLLTKFMRRLIQILSTNEFALLIKNNQPEENIELWSIAGMNNISIDQVSLLDPFINAALSKIEHIQDITSFEDMMSAMKALEFISEYASQSMGHHSTRFVNTIQKLWVLNYENINQENTFLKKYIGDLCQVTGNFVQYISDDQIGFILKKLKAISKTSFFKLQLCRILSNICNKLPQRTMGQSNLNSQLSDIFVMLLNDSDEAVKDLSLEIFRRFSSNNHYNIVNNVCRMLPSRNFEKYLQSSSLKVDMNEFIKTVEIGILDHVCLKNTSPELEQLISRNTPVGIIHETVREELVEERQRKLVSSEVSQRPVTQNKRFKSSENNLVDDDTIGEVLQRIKSEIKCLNKTLRKERLTPKNAQDIKIIISQLQNTLDYN